MEWVWIDTCKASLLLGAIGHRSTNRLAHSLSGCIDKRSSAELSEAINSMFAWYHKAVCCFVCLADVDFPGDPSDKSRLFYAYNYYTLRDLKDPTVKESFRRSSWFKRGWALHQLLAPQCILFCNSSWSICGYVGQACEIHCTQILTPPLKLLQDVAIASGISEDILSGQRKMSTTPTWLC